MVKWNYKKLQGGFMKELFIGFLISLFILSQGYCAVGWLKTKPAGTTSPADLDTNITENNNALDLALSGYAGGCKISYSTVAQLTVGAGGVVVSDSTGATRLMLANTAATTVTWSNIESGGSEAASTTYYVYAVGSATTDTVFTVTISTSSTTPTGVTYYKRLGSFYNDSSSNIINIQNDSQVVNYSDTGWFAISADTTYAKTHNLGTTKCIIQVFTSSSSDGSANCFGDFNATYDGGHTEYAGYRGVNICALTTTTVSIRANNLTSYTPIKDAAGTGITVAYARIILIALE